MITISDIKTEQTTTSRRTTATVSAENLPPELWMSCDGDVSLNGDGRQHDWIAIGLIYVAMLHGEDLNIDGVVSSSLLHDLNNDVQALLIAFRPELHRIKVSARVADDSPPAARGHVGTGFSAGVDSFTTLSLFDHAEAPPARRITCLATFNVGAMGGGSDAEAVFLAFRKRTDAYAAENSLKQLFVDTNLDAFYVGPLTGFQQTHNVRNAAAASFANDVFSCYLYSSTFPFEDINSSSGDMAHIEPMFLPLLSTNHMQLVSSGAGSSRIEKMAKIADFPRAHGLLDVCAAAPGVRLQAKSLNCSRCWKCGRAMLTLDVFGKLDAFAPVFDLDLYHRDKRVYVDMVCRSAMDKKPADRDVLALIERTGWTPGVDAWWGGRGFSIWLRLNKIKNTLKDIGAKQPFLRRLYLRLSGRG